MNALRQIEYAGRNCYRSHDKITDNSAPVFVRSLIRRGHLAPLEFADMSVELVTSRDVMAELTRHRLGQFLHRVAALCLHERRNCLHSAALLSRKRRSI